MEFYDALHDKHIKLYKTLLDNWLGDIYVDICEFYIENDYESESFCWLKDVDNSQDLSDLIIEVTKKLSKPNFDEWEIAQSLKLKSK